LNGERQAGVWCLVMAELKRRQKGEATNVECALASAVSRIHWAAKAKTQIEYGDQPSRSPPAIITQGPDEGPMCGSSSSSSIVLGSRQISRDWSAGKCRPWL